MCGIIAAFGKHNQKINKPLWKRYIEQKGRGSDGFGFITVGDTVSVYRAETEKEIQKMLHENKSDFIVFHHRYPTSTINCIEATHPIYVSHSELDFDYYVIHNGVLQNEDKLRDEHIALGYEYTTEIKEITKTEYVTKLQRYETSDSETLSFNDSESFAIDLARYLDGCSEKIESVGSIAFVCLRVGKSGKEKGVAIKMYYGHNTGNPLHIEENKDLFFIKSVGGVELKTDVLFSIDLKTGKRDEKEVAIGKTYTYTPPHTYNTKSYSESPTNNHLGFKTNVFDDDRYSEYDDGFGGYIASPYTIDDKDDAFIESCVERWIDLDNNETYWQDFVDDEKARLLYTKDEAEREKILISIDEAEFEVDQIADKKEQIENSFLAKYGTGVDLYEFVENKLYTK